MAENRQSLVEIQLMELGGSNCTYDTSLMLLPCLFLLLLINTCLNKQQKRQKIDEVWLKYNQWNLGAATVPLLLQSCSVLALVFAFDHDQSDIKNALVQPNCSLILASNSIKNGRINGTWGQQLYLCYFSHAPSLLYFVDFDHESRCKTFNLRQSKNESMIFVVTDEVNLSKKIKRIFRL